MNEIHWSVLSTKKWNDAERKNDDDDSVEKREIRRSKENDQGGKSLMPVKGTSYSILISKEREIERWIKKKSRTIDIVTILCLADFVYIVFFVTNFIYRQNNLAIVI